MKNILLIVMMSSYIVAAQSNRTKPFYIDNVINHAKWQTTQNVTYDRSYRQISYPNGDVPANIGVCTDVIIRAFRIEGIDLQVLVHESVKNNLRYYYPRPSKNYGKKPDANIDHRRVQILRKFFDKHYPESKLKPSDDYLPGDIIIWDNWHIGILIDEKIPGINRYYGVHNMGSGPQKADFYYFEDRSLDHYRLNFNN